MITFARDKPIEYRYDRGADVLYIKFADTPVDRTIKLLEDWPLLLVDLNAQDEIVGIEYVGAKQFSADYFTQAVHKRIWDVFGVKLGVPGPCLVGVSR